ncbi:hypothetical protein SteCoe_20005 [Stentor coeruleus]|uniref:Ubiquitin-like domain-containing protein n=1 Tax=Stentor coeruleus TaxID=5963 RepID=A0A1R2BSY9_9CILI|nr:hypothetical protein SteCoe_20005 [Stentor coeruleus]
MDTNDSEGTNPTSVEEGNCSRYSKRVRKPFKVYQPEVSHSKTKKKEFDVNCEILKNKGITPSSKNINFTITSNLTTVSIMKKFTKAAGLKNLDCFFVYYCEKKQSKFYLEWKKLTSYSQLNVGTTYKIRLYRAKKMEKKEPAPVIKKIESKMAETPKIASNTNITGVPDMMYQSMQWYYLCQYMMTANYMMNAGFPY